MKVIKTFFIRTYGCQMNELDSEILLTQLDSRGLKLAKSEQEADLIIFNTCSVRDLAEKKVLGKISEFKNDNKIIGIAGCMAMSLKDTLLKDYKYIDFILGTNDLLKINEILDDLQTKNIQINKTSENYDISIDNFFAKRNSPLKASISIIRGCNNFCSYCIVPFTRGREISRSKNSIIKEFKYLANLGYKEITLLGQNVNSYGKDFTDEKFLFSDLLYELNKIDGIERIRFMTSHPKDISIELMHAIKDLEKVCEFVHFPIQSGSNKILKKMNRKYTRESYLEKVNLLRQVVPNVAIGTDIIIGFPEETEEDFQDTFNLFKEVKYDTAFIFAYSPRRGTLASKWKDEIPKDIKNKRLQELLSLYHEILQEKYRSYVGDIRQVLVERLNKDQKMLKGRTKRFEKVIFEGKENLIGSLQNVKIESFNHQTLIGSLAKD
ncbi:MAG: tRNA (N6-isopentenyl adenosine(37)-C2)-methylthiotransferase MiaB [Parachlamydiales bacterium]|nr:tRNA (N6-isopentenyl adenosine(37)-C2)-methylthiotransferase MiaB [Parachlamydiales bacterium]